jgi:chemotaxis regulatin CheY-phosphate phosphatase CheZ
MTVLRVSRVRWLAGAIAVMIALGACSRSDDSPKVAASAPAEMQAQPAGRTVGVVMRAEPAQQDMQQNARTTEARYIAYTHRYAIEAERARLRTVLDAHLARCKEIDCVVLSQTFAEENDHNPPSAALSVRVARKDTAKFTDALKSGDGRVVNQSSVAEDKTLQVVDIEARSANLTQLRDRLRKLMADPKAGIKEAVEIERQLAQTQGELDSMQSQRRVLAQQTERELFDIHYQSRRSAVERNIFEPVKDALLSFGGVFMRSVAGLISFVAASLVWIVLALVLWRVIRRWRRRRSVTKSV